jgi:Ulp1 family protease
MYVRKQKQDGANVKQSMLNPMAGRRCANFPRCCLQVGVCGGITKKGCIAFKNDLLLDFSDNGGDDETTLIKKRRKEQKKAQRLMKQVKREAATSKERATNSVQASAPIIIMLDSVSIRGPILPGRGAVIVQPVDSMALFQTGSLINDNVVQGYLNMLAHKAATLDIELSTLAPQFYPVLRNSGWNGVDRWLRATKLSEANWGTSRLIFLPIFLGANDYGHWTSLIADRNVLKQGLLVFSDSLPAGTAARNSNQVSRSLENTPLLKDGHTWVNTNMIDQAASSNDCAVFMLLTFAAYLLAMRDAPGGNIEIPEHLSRIEISNRRLTAGESGRIGRRHIYNSICAGKINLDDEAIRDLKIQFI